MIASMIPSSLKCNADVQSQNIFVKCFVVAEIMAKQLHVRDFCIFYSVSKHKHTKI